MTNVLLDQRAGGIEFLAENLSRRGHEIQERPWGLKAREDYHPGIYKQMSRDILVEGLDGLEYQVSYSTEPFPAIEFLQKLVASSNMNIQLVPVLRKSVETFNQNTFQSTYDGEFFIRTQPRKSIVEMEQRRQFLTIDAKITERVLAHYATHGIIPYFQPENERHPDSIRIYRLRNQVKLDHTYTGMPWAWEKGTHKSKRFREAILQNPPHDTEVTLMPIFPTPGEINHIKEKYVEFLDFLEKWTHTPDAEPLKNEVKSLENITTGLLVPTRLDQSNDFPLLFLSLRYALNRGDSDNISLLQDAIENRKSKLDERNPYINYELSLYEYHKKALDKIKN